ncbi:arginine deiminase-related protein [Stenotrophomonas sp. MMGLT7]|uniref:dimethylarginine dimethylaminohydrolase family protein n=1 Tax=Stenotrophomonas sp. MMGLT7 TaxID=2901227 RepID=UPI001E347F58|nr:arginine deiminase-related protein [Stenotrophomonas sp. MMGLT7]MCD7098753.1 arginine deiminase-related protein [Stenotrophomonas sp. MMGLT7]
MNGHHDSGIWTAEAPPANDALAHASPAAERRGTPLHRLLMCPPGHFAVEYVINPWMEGQVHRADRHRATAQWQALHDALGAAGAVIEQVPPGAGLPDMPFSANAGLVLGNDFVPSRFRHPERRGEEALFIDWFERAGFRIRRLPGAIFFEGAGDALLDRGERRLWMGHGHRSDLAAAAELERMLDLPVVPLRLVDPRFYHLDTCFCPLRGGRLLYFPAAFDAASRQAIEARVPPHLRIAVGEADALDFACNAVDLDEAVAMHRASPALQRALAGFGYRVVQTALDEFLRAGGSAKCLTLRLDE